MAPRASIVLFLGWISRKPVIEMSTLAAIDGAIGALTRTMALEQAPVRVNAITPGQIDTPLWRSRLSETEAQAHFDRVAPAHPMGRVGTVDDVTQAVLFLITNGFMTSAVLDIDRGWRWRAVPLCNLLVAAKSCGSEDFSAVTTNTSRIPGLRGPPLGVAGICQFLERQC